MPSKNPLTPKIIIEALKRSSLNHVLIEGKDDLQIYRLIEQEIDSIQVNFLPCNGKTNLLEVYKAKNDISAKLLFICDSDLWIFFGQPIEEIDSMISTDGYCIENELYEDGKDFIKKLFSEEEFEKIQRIIKNVCEWFAFEVSLVSENAAHNCEFSKVSILNEKIIRKKEEVFTTEFLQERAFAAPPIELFEDIFNNHSLKLRGKFLFQILNKVFRERQRSEVQYNKKQLFDLIYRTISSSNDNNKIMIKRKENIISYFDK